MSLFSYEQLFKSVNLNKVKYLTMVEIANLLIEQGATIFGGFVRDKYIHDHYASIFYEKGLNENEYDDATYDPETKHRLLVPYDIDVFVKGDEEEIEKIYSFIKEKGFKVEIKKRKVIYGAFENIKQQKVVIRTKGGLGSPYAKIKLDILYSSEDVKPPFKRLDLWCNSLLMDQNGITISNQTGSHVDNWDLFSRKKVEIEILDSLLKFETRRVEFVSEPTDEQSIKNKKMINNRIESMEKRGWKIKEEL